MRGVPSQPPRRSRCSTNASRTYSEQPGTNRHAAGSSGRTSIWYAHTTWAATCPALIPRPRGTPGAGHRPGGAYPRPARGRGGWQQWAAPPRPSRYPRPSALERADMPRESGVEPDCDGRRPATADSPRSPHAAAPLVARVRRNSDVRVGYHAGRPPGIPLLAGGARLEAALTPPEPSPPCAWLDGEALASLSAPPLQDLAPALCLHPRAKSVRLLAPAPIRLERPLHANSPLA